MRRLLDVGFDALQFQRLHGGGVALDFFFQPVNELALLDDDAIELFHLMFEVREVRLELVHAPGMFVCHANNLPVSPSEVEAVMVETSREGREVSEAVEGKYFLFFATFAAFARHRAQQIQTPDKGE
jgi:hypothetical protein